jgi:hypothetical protein
MNEHDELRDPPEQLRVLAQTLHPLEAPAHVERSLVAAYRKRRARQGWTRLWWRVLAPAAAVALALLVLLPRPEAPAEPALSEVTTDYFPVGYGPPLAPDEYRQVIRVSLPRAEMVRFGLPMYGGAGSAQVRADVIVGEDGVARAIRFVE